MFKEVGKDRAQKPSQAYPQLSREFALSVLARILVTRWGVPWRSWGWVVPHGFSLSPQHHIRYRAISSPCWIPDTDHRLSSGLICCSFSNWWKHQGHVTTSGGGQSRLGSPKLKLWRRRWWLVFYFLCDRSYQISSMLETVSWKNYERIPSVAIALSHKNLTGV